MNSGSNMSVREPTVGIIIIGDEILKGHTQETNSHFLCKRLFSLGVKVKRISVIADDLSTIAAEVSKFSDRYTHVITSGGIGPTHDDVTFQGIAEAFGDEVTPHPDLVSMCKEFFGTDDLSNPKLKLAFVPKSAKLLYGVNEKTGQKHRFPLVTVRNVYVFPGVPQLMERLFNMMEDIFRNPETQVHVKEIFLAPDEASVTGVINQVDARFKDTIVLGSYPDFYNSYYKVKLTLESESLNHINEACQYIHQHLPKGSIVEYEKDPVGQAADRVYQFIDTSEDNALIHSVRHGVNVIEECFQRYSVEEVCIGFNGGKDCTALLHMAYAAFKRKHPTNSKKLQILYIRRGQPFPELELFIKTSIKMYQLEVITIYGRIREALAEMKTTHPHIKAVVMGTRRTDPYSNHLESFSMTDSDWPQYMRVNPMLDWSYSHVWAFLRKLNLPYCILYDRGYTSLGSMENTHPNPELQQVDAKGIITYRPAHELQEDHKERAGRN